MNEQETFNIVSGPGELDTLISFTRSKPVPFVVEKTSTKEFRQETWKAIVIKMEIINNPLRESGVWKIKARVVRKIKDKQERPVKNLFFQGLYNNKEGSGKVKGIKIKPEE